MINVVNITLISTQPAFHVIFMCYTLTKLFRYFTSDSSLRNFDKFNTFLPSNNVQTQSQGTEIYALIWVEVL
jgi:hypothetical protein